MRSTIEPAIPMNAKLTCIITEWFGFKIGVTAFINATMALRATMPIKYAGKLKGPRNTVKNTHRSIYHAMDSDIIRYPLSRPKCSVSYPDTMSFPLVIAKGEYCDFDRISTKNIIAARGIVKSNGPCMDW